MVSKRKSRGLRRPRRAKLLQKKLYIIVGEGERTEKEYFQIFSPVDASIMYSSPSDHHGGNVHTLIKEIGNQKRRHSQPSAAAPTEYWIIADVERSDAGRNLTPLFQWVKKNENHHLGLTNQQFENWLLLHFQKKIASSNPVNELRKYIPQYTSRSKGIGNTIQLSHVFTAIENARSANVISTDIPSNVDEIPINHTSVPVLVGKLI